MLNSLFAPIIRSGLKHLIGSKPTFVKCRPINYLTCFVRLYCGHQMFAHMGLYVTCSALLVFRLVVFRFASL